MELESYLASFELNLKWYRMELRAQLTIERLSIDLDEIKKEIERAQNKIAEKTIEVSLNVDQILSYDRDYFKDLQERVVLNKEVLDAQLKTLKKPELIIDNLGHYANICIALAIESLNEVKDAIKDSYYYVES